MDRESFCVTHKGNEGDGVAWKVTRPLTEAEECETQCDHSGYYRGPGAYYERKAQIHTTKTRSLIKIAFGYDI